MKIIKGAVNNFQLVTITHQTANINHIGKYIPSVNSDSERLGAKLQQIKKALHVEELLYLATCNRLTFLFVCKQEINKQFVINLFQALEPEKQIDKNELLGVSNILRGEECIRHLFEIASSLNSLVVGEREILRQLKAAYEFCLQYKLTGDSIRVAMKATIPIAKEVYTDTKIGENSVSVVSLAMQKMARLKLSENAKILIIGAGQTNNLVAKFLLKKDYENFVVFNRTVKNAELLANKLNKNAKAYELSDLATYKGNFDVIITCTSADKPVITEKIYRNLIGDDNSKKVIIDLSVPNDIDPVVIQKFPITYIEVEKLRQLADKNLQLRKKEVIKAQKIIEKKLTEFKLIYRQRRVERALKGIPKQVKEVRKKAIDTVFQKQISTMDADAKKVLEDVMKYMEQKYISIPMEAARTAVINELNL